MLVNAFRTADILSIVMLSIGDREEKSLNFCTEEIRVLKCFTSAINCGSFVYCKFSEMTDDN